MLNVAAALSPSSTVLEESRTKKTLVGHCYNGADALYSAQIPSFNLPSRLHTIVSSAASYRLPTSAVVTSSWSVICRQPALSCTPPRTRFTSPQSAQRLRYLWTAGPLFILLPRLAYGGGALPRLAPAGSSKIFSAPGGRVLAMLEGRVPKIPSGESLASGYFVADHLSTIGIGAD